MRPGETIEVKTPNAVAAVRGTVFVVDVTRTRAARDDARAASVTSTFYGFSGPVRVTIANLVFTLSPDTFLSATGSQPPTTGTMTADMREQALSGLQTGAQPVSAGQAGAKDQALGSTVTTLADALPSVRTPLVMNPLTLPTPPTRA